VTASLWNPVYTGVPDPKHLTRDTTRRGERSGANVCGLDSLSSDSNSLAFVISFTTATSEGCAEVVTVVDLVDFLHYPKGKWPTHSSGEPRSRTGRLSSHLRPSTRLQLVPRSPKSLQHEAGDRQWSLQQQHWKPTPPHHR